MGTSFATLSVAPHTYKNVPYHPVNDFAPISLFAITQAGLCVTAALPVKSTRELIDHARSRQGKLLMASAGIGSTSHLAGLMFATAAGIESTHVPYKGGGPSGEKRSAIFPELPTIGESGVPGFKFLGWNGVLAPRATPRAVVDRVNAALVQALKTPDVRQLYAAQGEEPAWTTPEEYAKIVREDFERYGKVVKQAGVKVE